MRIKLIDLVISCVFLVTTWGTVEYGLHWFFGNLIISEHLETQRNKLWDKLNNVDRELRNAQSLHNTEDIHNVENERIKIKSELRSVDNEILKEKTAFSNRYIISFFVITFIFGILSLLFWFIFHMGLLASVLFMLSIILFARAYIQYWPYIGYGTGFLTLGIVASVLITALIYRLSKEQ